MMRAAKAWFRSAAEDDEEEEDDATAADEEEDDDGSLVDADAGLALSCGGGMRG